MAGQMERREYVYLIDAGKREGAAAERWGGFSGGWGRGEHVEQCQNHRHICCSSQMFPISFKCFLQPCESVPSCQDRRGLVFDFLCVCVCWGNRWSFTFFFFSLDLPINYPNLERNARKYKSMGTHLYQTHIHTARKANKWLLMCSVSQAEKQMPSTHKSTQLLQASVDNYLYRN